MKTLTVSVSADITTCTNVIFDELKKHGPLEIEIFVINQKGKQRSPPQNASLHKYCSTMAEKLNDAGYAQRQLVGSFKEGFELPATMDMIKSIFREVGKAMFKKESTKDLTTIEVQEVYKVVDARFGEITGVRSEWPSIDSLRNEQENRYKKKPDR